MIAKPATLALAATLFLGGCVSRDRYGEDIAACIALVPAFDHARAADPSYPIELMEARKRQRACEERAFVAAERRDASTAAALAGIRATGASLRRTGDEMSSRPLPSLTPPPSAPTGPGPTGLEDMYSVERPDRAIPRECFPDAPVGYFLSQSTHCPR